MLYCIFMHGVIALYVHFNTKKCLLIRKTTNYALYAISLIRWYLPLCHKSSGTSVYIVFIVKLKNNGNHLQKKVAGKSNQS